MGEKTGERTGGEPMAGEFALRVRSQRRLWCPRCGLLDEFGFDARRSRSAAAAEGDFLEESEAVW